MLSPWFVEKRRSIWLLFQSHPLLIHYNTEYDLRRGRWPLRLPQPTQLTDGPVQLTIPGSPATPI